MGEQGVIAVPAFDRALRQRQVRFLEALSVGGNVRTACRAASVAPATAYRWRRACRHFARGWEAALVVARAQVEEVLADRALNGVSEEIWHRGELVGERRRHDTRLLLAHLARLDARAADMNIADAAAQFDDALEHFARDGTLGVPEREADTGEALAAPASAPENPWDDESLPLVERAMLYLDAMAPDAGAQEADAPAASHRGADRPADFAADFMAHDTADNADPRAE